MGFKNKFKKDGVSKQQWLDWLNDETPSAAAQAELRTRRLEQANAYQRRPVAPVAPTQPAPKPIADGKPAAVSIQIEIPGFDAARWRQRWHNFLKRLTRLYHRLGQLVASHKRQTIGGSIVAVLVLGGLFGPHLVHFGRHASSTADSASGGSNGATSGGASTGYTKPPFQVVVPSTKAKLATPDGSHSAYDGKRNSFSYSDSLKGNGFIVSQQPIPAQFKTGADAVAGVARQLSSPLTTARAIDTLFGSAQVVTNTKYSSQTVVFSIRDLLLFIQSSHSFTDTDWTDYINALQ